MPARRPGFAGLPEYRVSARSNVPQKNWTRLVRPVNLERCSLKIGSIRESTCQKRFTDAGSYVRCTRSSGNAIGSGTSDGTTEIVTSNPSDRRSSMTPR